MEKMNLGIVLLLCLALFGCTKSPGDTTKDFFSLVDKGKVNDAYVLLTKSSQEMLQVVGGATFLSEMTKEIETQKKGIKSITVEKEDVKGDMAQVTLKITCNTGNPETQMMKLIKEDGKWRIILK